MGDLTPKFPLVGGNFWISKPVASYSFTQLALNNC